MRAGARPSERPYAPAAEPAARSDPPLAPPGGAPAVAAEGLAVSRGRRVLFLGLDLALARGEWAAG